MVRRSFFFALGMLPVLGLFAYNFRDAGPEDNRTAQEHQVETGSAPLAFTESERLRQDLLASLATAPGQGFPATLPWHTLHEIGRQGGIPLENLLHAQPLTFLQMCLDRYEQEVEGYRLTFRKRERVGGKLYPADRDKYETVQVHYRERPFSVHFNWVQEPKLAQKVLYVEGENDNKMLARPRGLLGALVVSRDVDGADAKSSGRYTIDQFGLQQAMQRTVDAMRKAEARGQLFLEYQGVVSLAEVGNRPCYKFVRTPYVPTEEDGINELVIYVDQETWLQVGSVLKDAEGNLIAEYFFSDIVLNPEFDPQQFTRAAL